MSNLLLLRAWRRDRRLSHVGAGGDSAKVNTRSHCPWISFQHCCGCRPCMRKRPEQNRIHYRYQSCGSAHIVTIRIQTKKEEGKTGRPDRAEQNKITAIHNCFFNTTDSSLALALALTPVDFVNHFRLVHLVNSIICRRIGDITSSHFIPFIPFLAFTLSECSPIRVFPHMLNTHCFPAFFPPFISSWAHNQ